MATTIGRCSNFDLCPIADRRIDIEVPAGHAFICPECGKPLGDPGGDPPLSGQRGGQRFVLLAVVLVVVIGGALYITSRLAPKNNLLGVAPPWTQKPAGAQ